MSKTERDKIFARVVANRQWKEDLLDMITIAERRKEPRRSIDNVFKRLRIDA
ncbi:MAG TPA: hypothetical protein VGM62_12455 [Chthoniobacterales bacterium]